MVKTKIGIFQGKQAKYNKYLLETLYFNGPLTAWQLTKKATKTNLHSLHAIFNKRLRILQKKGYVQKSGKLWLLQFKGTLAVLISQAKPKPWNKNWNQILENYLKNVKDVPKLTVSENSKEIINLTEYIKAILKNLNDFESWVSFANKIKSLMDNGFINFDIIKNKTLFGLCIIEFLGDSHEG